MKKHERHIRHLTRTDIAALPHDAAARKIVTKVPIADPHDTLHDMQRMLREHMDDFETVNYVYVVDEWGKFVGVLSIKDMYRHDEKRPLGELCKREGLVSVHPDDRQEHAAYVALRHNLKAVPVLDRDHHFLGVLPSDVILRILYKEMHEDMLRRVGVRDGSVVFDNVLHMTVATSVWHRAPWLFIGLVGGIASASIIGLFEHTLSKNIILAGFIPLVVYMGGAVGAQTQTFMIRDLAMDRKMRFWKYFLRQAAVIVCLAMLFSMAMFAYAFLRFNHPGVVLTLTGALGASIASSVLSGVFIPYALSRFRMDPANAGGPLVTIAQDIVSIMLYFWIAEALL